MGNDKTVEMYDATTIVACRARRPPAIERGPTPLHVLIGREIERIRVATGGEPGHSGWTVRIGCPGRAHHAYAYVGGVDGPRVVAAAVGVADLHDVVRRLLGNLMCEEC